MLNTHAVIGFFILYTAFGMLFGLAFVAGGVSRVDSGARGAGVAFRLLILPGTIALWPLMLGRWVRAAKGGPRS